MGKVLAACLSGGLLTAGANAINDYFDLEIDRINKPERPLPSGRISKKEALIFAVVNYAAANTIAAFISPVALAICFVFSVLLYFYSALFKRIALLGNLVVSLATGAAFVYGGAAVGRFGQATIPASFAFLMHLGRELIKDMEDIEGDRRNKARTMPVLFGVLPTQVLTTVILLLLLIATVLPGVFHIYGKYYLFIVIAGVHTVLFYTLFSLWLSPHRDTFRRLSALLKLDMLVGLLAIYAGRW